MTNFEGEKEENVEYLLEDKIEVSRTVDSPIGEVD